MHKRFDNQIIRKSTGQYYKIFVPSWWEFWRWIMWLFVSRAQIKLSIDNNKGKGELFLRCYKVKDGLVQNKKLLNVK